MHDERSGTEAPAPRRRSKLVAAGVLLTVAGPAVYFALLDYPWLRSTAVVPLTMMPAGAVTGVWAATRSRRWWAWLAAGFDVVMLASFAGSMLLLMKVPEATGFEAMSVAPDFTVQDQEGRDFHLADALGHGPVLLVFYRGHW